VLSRGQLEFADQSSRARNGREEGACGKSPTAHPESAERYKALLFHKRFMEDLKDRSWRRRKKDEGAED